MARYNRKDHLYKKAKEEGLRSRATFKLDELDDKFGFLKGATRVVDLGCAPGGWLQIAAKRSGKSARIIGVDLLDTSPVSSTGRATVDIIKGDFTEEAIQKQVCDLLDGSVDVVLSDMSPNLSGVYFTDSVRSAQLVELALYFSKQVLREGGTFLAKIFPSADADQLFGELKKDFKSCSRHTLKSSRKTSKEVYFVARGFKGEQITRNE